MDLAAKKLTDAGFERYEVASYAQPGQRCRHNIAYWIGKPYLGLGRSAAGMLDIPSAPEMCNLGTYPFYTSGANLSSALHEGRLRYRQLDDEGVQFDTEHLTLREAMAEDLMLACRMTDGIPLDLLTRATSCIPETDLRAACESAVSSGLATWDEDALGKARSGPPTSAGSMATSCSAYSGASLSSRIGIFLADPLRAAAGCAMLCKTV